MTRTPNPFYVLELAPDCTRAEVERAGQKLLAMLELELKGASRFTTPHGAHRRDAALVREAMAELRDPQRRLFHELWAQPQPWSSTPTPASPTHEISPSHDFGFDAALAALGWR